MQEGVGRHGYRMLALFAFIMGLVGLMTSLYAFRPTANLFNWLGFAFEFIAIGILFFLVLTVIQVTIPTREAARQGRGPQNGAATGPLRTLPNTIPGAPVPPQPAGAPPLAVGAVGLAPGMAPSGGGFEFPDDQVEPAPKDPKAWPKRGKAAKAVRDPAAERHELATKYTENAPELRQILTKGGWPNAPEKVKQHPASAALAPPETPGDIIDDSMTGPSVAVQVPTPPRGRASAQVEVPTIVARAAGPEEDADWLQEGMGRGRCGGCGIVLIAPKERPVRLRCPKCDKETLLK